MASIEIKAQRANVLEEKLQHLGAKLSDADLPEPKRALLEAKKSAIEDKLHRIRSSPSPEGTETSADRISKLEAKIANIDARLQAKELPQQRILVLKAKQSYFADKLQALKSGQPLPRGHGGGRGSAPPLDEMQIQMKSHERQLRLDMLLLRARMLTAKLAAKNMTEDRRMKLTARLDKVLSRASAIRVLGKGGKGKGGKGKGFGKGFGKGKGGKGESFGKGKGKGCGGKGECVDKKAAEAEKERGSGPAAMPEASEYTFVEASPANEKDYGGCFADAEVSYFMSPEYGEFDESSSSESDSDSDSDLDSEKE